MTISQIMCDDVKCCGREATLADVIHMMWEYDLGCVPVTDSQGVLVGIITDRDICIATFIHGKPPDDLSVEGSMKMDVVVCHPDSRVEEVEAIMCRSQLRRIPVVNVRAELVGIVSLNDLAREAQRETDNHGQPAVSLKDVAMTLGAVGKPRKSFEYPTV